MTGMDLEKIAGVEPPVDEQAVMEEVEAYVEGVDMQRKPWRIDTLGQADWAMRRLAEARDFAQRYEDEVALWTAALKKIGRVGSWFEDRLKEWAVAERTKDRKTFAVAHGTVATRESKPRIVVEDEKAAVEWALTYAPAAVKVERSLLVSQLGDAATIGRVAIGWTATNKATGETQRIPATGGHVTTSLDVVRQRMGDDWQVDIDTHPAVVDKEGRPVPGLVVAEGRVTATVTPLGV